LLIQGEVRDHIPKAPVAVQRRQVRRALREGVQLLQARQIRLLDREFLPRPAVASPCADFIHGLSQDLYEPGRISDVQSVVHRVRRLRFQGREERPVVVPQHALVVPDRGDSLVAASSEDITLSSGHTVAARGDADVAAAEKEPMGLVGTVLASGGGGKAVGAGRGVGGEGREDSVEVGLVGGVGSEETNACAKML